MTATHLDTEKRMSHEAQRHEHKLHGDNESDAASRDNAKLEQNNLQQTTSRSGGLGSGGIKSKVAFVSLCILWVGPSNPFSLREFASMALLTVRLGSQVPLYFLGGTLAYVSKDIGGKAITQNSWMPVSNTLALAAVAPFSGYMTDIFGRRNITIIGGAAIVIGMHHLSYGAHFRANDCRHVNCRRRSWYWRADGSVGVIYRPSSMCIVTTADEFSLCSVAELVPVKNRGFYLATVVMFLAPFTPYVLYSQLLSTRTEQGWRWGQWISL